MHGFLPTRTIPPPTGNNVPVPKAIGVLTATGTTPWMPAFMVPNAFYAHLFGTATDAVSATAHFEFSDDGNFPAAKGSTITLSGTGNGPAPAQPADFGADASVSPWTPWKWVRLNVTAITGTGAAVKGFQALGS